MSGERELQHFWVFSYSHEARMNQIQLNSYVVSVYKSSNTLFLRRRFKKKKSAVKTRGGVIRAGHKVLYKLQLIWHVLKSTSTYVSRLWCTVYNLLMSLFNLLWSVDSLLCGLLINSGWIFNVSCKPVGSLLHPPGHVHNKSFSFARHVWRSPQHS